MSDQDSSAAWTDRQIEDGRRLFTGPCDFILGAASLDQIPESDLPELAVVGRSNVGKSSLINSLTGRKALARTSNTPGRTQEINFFDLGGVLVLADLPGYGFARAPKAKVKRWTALINDYLRGRAQLRRVLVLVDARHGLKPSDGEMMEMLDAAAVSYQIVFTKADKVKPNPLRSLVSRTEQVLVKHVAAHPLIHVTSAVKGVGLEALRADLAGLAAPSA